MADGGTAKRHRKVRAREEDTSAFAAPSPADIERYHAEGFLIVRNVLSADEVALVTEAIMRNDAIEAHEMLIDDSKGGKVAVRRPTALCSSHPGQLHGCADRRALPFLLVRTGKTGDLGSARRRYAGQPHAQRTHLRRGAGAAGRRCAALFQQTSAQAPRRHRRLAVAVRPPSPTLPAGAPRHRNIDTHTDTDTPSAGCTV